MKKRGLWIIAGLLAVCMLFSGCDAVVDEEEYPLLTGSTDEGEDPPLTGTVTITGMPEVGYTLSVNTDNVDNTLDGTFSCQWKRADTADADGTDITGATGSYYELGAEDEGKFISVTVTCAGYSGSVTSDAAGPIEAAALPDPAADDFNLGNLIQTVGNVTAVTITPKTGKSDGVITIYYNGSTTLPSTAGTYIVTFDVAAATGWNEAIGLSAGTLTINPAEPDPIPELDSIVIDNLMYYFYQEIALPTASGGLAVTWTSDDPNYPVKNYLSNAANQNLKRVMVRDNVDGEFNFNLTAKVTKNGTEYQRTFPVTALEKNYYGYLLAYFTDDGIPGEQVRYALSTDGFNFIALNNNQPVIPSPEIARTGSVRDPYFVRGHDGVFRMVITDMRSASGWNSNRGIVLLKSTDLINWTHSQIHFPDRFGGNFADDQINCVWAPEVIYDRKSGGYLVHFAVTQKNIANYQKMFYSWANDDFTDLATTPVVIYEVSNSARIDLNIVNFNNVFHGVIKNESSQGIEKIESSTINSGYSVVSSRIDNESNRVEGAELYRLIGSDTWVHMYDAYDAKRFGFQTSTNMRTWTAASSSFRVTPGGSTFIPKHGSVIPLTREEYDRLNTNQVWMTTVVNPTVTVDAPLKLHYTFDSGDTTASGGIKNKATGYAGTNNGSVAGNGGSLTTTNGMPNFYTGTNTGTGTGSTTPGYIDMGASASSLITGQEDYTIAAYIRLESESNPTTAGWFLWCMANTTGADKTSGRYTFFRAYVASRQTYSVSGYGTESNVQPGGNLPRNRWIHVMYREAGDIGAVYIDGQVVAFGKHTIKNTNLPGSGNSGAIQYNWLGRPCFSSDNYMSSTRYADFRIYSGAISESQIAALGIPARLAQLNN